MSGVASTPPVGSTLGGSGSSMAAETTVAFRDCVISPVCTASAALSATLKRSDRDRTLSAGAAVVVVPFISSVTLPEVAVVSSPG